MQASLHEEKGLACDDPFIFVEGFAGNEEVGNAIFIFERDEAVTFGSAWPLTANHQACDDQGFAMGHFKKTHRSGEIKVLLASPKPHGMWPGRGALQSEIGVESFARSHHFENLFLCGWRGEEIINRQLLGPPKSITAVFDFRKIIEGSGGGEKTPFFDVGTDTEEEIIQ